MTHLENVRKVYVYAEHTWRGGEIAINPVVDAKGPISDDVFLWGEGTYDELTAQSLEILAIPSNIAPHFRHRCARNVLDYIDGPTVKLHYEPTKGRYWLPVKD